MTPSTLIRFGRLHFLSLPRGHFRQFDTVELLNAQDKEDDVKAGVKSTALLFGSDTKRWLSGFAALSTASFAACGMAVGAGPAFFAGVAGVAVHYTWQIGVVDLNDRADCWDKFNSNKWLGLTMTTGIVADRLLAEA